MLEVFFSCGYPTYPRKGTVAFQYVRYLRLLQDNLIGYWLQDTRYSKYTPPNEVTENMIKGL